MTTTVEKEKKRLREYLNPLIQGPNTDAVLEALAHGPVHLVNNVEAVYDSLYIASASGDYLSQILSQRNFIRPDLVGLSDDIFRELGIEVTNRKQVRDLMLKVLETMYGKEYTRATCVATNFEPYNLADGDNLKIQFDDGEIVEVTFSASQFTNIGSASAQEVADSITKSMIQLGKTGSAFVNNDGTNNYVDLISSTIGPSSSVKVFGGKAQNALRFPTIKNTTAQLLTEWSISYGDKGLTRLTWIGGPNPSLGKVQAGDYVNIFGGTFSANNQGVFNIAKAVGGLVNESYVEFDNPASTPQALVTQGLVDQVLFYSPTRFTVTSDIVYATAYQTDTNVFQVIMPATTKTIRRSVDLASYIIDYNVPSTNTAAQPYIFDYSQPYVIAEHSCSTTTVVDNNIGLIIPVDNSANFPDTPGYLVFDYGLETEEGPVPYISRPSTNTIMVNPIYKFKYTHQSGSTISLVQQNAALEQKNSDIQGRMYLTDVSSGRQYTEDILNLVVAAGVTLVITIIYPNPVGLENYKKTEEIQKTWKQVWD